MRYGDFFLGDNAILTVEPEFREGKVAVYFRVMRGGETVQVIRFIDPDLALQICNAFYMAARRVETAKEIEEDEE